MVIEHSSPESKRTTHVPEGQPWTKLALMQYPPGKCSTPSPFGECIPGGQEANDSHAPSYRSPLKKNSHDSLPDSVTQKQLSLRSTVISFDGISARKSSFGENVVFELTRSAAYFKNAEVSILLDKDEKTSNIYDKVLLIIETQE